MDTFIPFIHENKKDNFKQLSLYIDDFIITDNNNHENDQNEDETVIILEII